MISNISRNRFKPKAVATFLAVVLILGIVSLLVNAYFFSPRDEPLKENIGGIFPYPVAILGLSDAIVYSSEIRHNLEAIKKYYENKEFLKTGTQIDFSTDDGRLRLKVSEKEILSKAIESKAIEILAEKRRITITKNEIDLAFSEKVAQFEIGDAVDDDLKKMYGWNSEQFRDAVVIPELYADKLKKDVVDELSKERTSRDLIEKAKKELDGGADFSAVARNYSQGSSAVEGGDFGWIAKDQLLPEIAEKIFSASPSDKNKVEIIESELGYHIIGVEENKRESGVDMVRIKQIFVRKTTFGDWLGEQMKAMDIRVLPKGYVWNNEEALLEFEDPAMGDFEKNI